jgi:integrase
MTKTKTRHRNGGLYKRCEHPHRQWSKCSCAWWMSFKPRGGKAHRISLDKHAGKHISLKSDAETLAASLRTLISEGKYGQQAPVLGTLTLRQLLDLYDRRYLATERERSAKNLKYQIATILGTSLPFPTGGVRAFGDFAVTDISTDVVESFREVRRVAGVAAANRDLSFLRAAFSWAIRVGYLEKTPFKLHGEAVVKLTRELPRSRRLHDDEAERLLAACSGHLRAVVEGALESGLRRGELLSLAWREVVGMTVNEKDHTVTWAPRAEIVVTAVKAKTRVQRSVPISSRLRAVLEARRFDPAGNPLPPAAFVFGTSIGTRLADFGRAWESAVLRSPGWTPAYTATKNLDAASREALRQADLHFHDLRHEAGSRWMDGGVPLATIQRWLGHSNAAQTSRYLAGTSANEHAAMQAFEARRVKQCETDSEKRDQTREPVTTDREEMLRESASDRQMPVM